MPEGGELVLGTAGDVAPRTEQRRVTVVGARRRVDLAVPARAPIAEYVPSLLRWCGQLEFDEVFPRVWSLAPSGEATLPPHACLAELGVADGATLYLRDAAAGELDEPVVTDLDDLVAEAAPAGPAWDESTRARTMVVLGVAALVVGFAALFAVGQRGPGVAVGALAAGLLLALAGRLATRRAWPLPLGVRLVVALGPVPLFAVMGAGLAWGADDPAAAPIGAGMGAMLGAALATLCLRHAVTVGVWCVTLAALVVLAVASGLGLDAGQVAALVVLGCAGLLAAGPAPAGRLVETTAPGANGTVDTLGADGTVGANGTVGTEGEPDAAARVASWVGLGRRAHVTITAGCAALAGAATVLLGTAPDPFAAGMAASAGVLLVLRAADGPELGAALPLVAAGCAGPVTVAVCAGGTLGVPGWIGPVVLVAVAAAAVAIGVARAAAHPGAAPAGEPARHGGWVVALTVLTVLCGLGVLGVFTFLVGLGMSL